jgi:bifunctional non-homologous end joining protein LigD
MPASSPDPECEAGHTRLATPWDSVFRCGSAAQRYSLPTSAAKPPSGERWLHEIKHDGFRLIARKIGRRVKLYSRSGNDLTYRFPLIVEAVAKLRVRSCIIDGEAVACADNGLSSFDRICYRQNDASVFMWAFDLIELDGDDLRLDRLEARKDALPTLLMRAAPGLRLNEHMDEDDGPVVFVHEVGSRTSRANAG